VLVHFRNKCYSKIPAKSEFDSKENIRWQKVKIRATIRIRRRRRVRRRTRRKGRKELISIKFIFTQTRLQSRYQ
jgi:hypothetical protein